MRHRVIRIGLFCLAGSLVLAGCQTAKKAFVPITGDGHASLPAQVESTRGQIVEYLISSSHLETAPPREGWQLEMAEQNDGGYHLLNGDWVMVVWSANAPKESQRVILRNKATHAVWCGYIQPDGQIVDTSHLP